MSQKAMFRRRGFNPAGNYSTTPKWHRTESVDRSKGVYGDPGSHGGSLAVHALCGYVHSVPSAFASDGIGYSDFEWRDEIKTKKLRCAKCDAAMEKKEISRG